MTVLTIDAYKPDECRGCPYFDRRRVAPAGAVCNHTSVLLLGDYPSLTTPEQGKPFSDRRGVVLKTALARLRGKYHNATDGKNRWAALTQYSTYAVQCVPEDKPPKGPTKQCNTLLNGVFLKRQPVVAVVFGATAFNSLGIGKTKFSDARGMFQDYTFIHNGTSASFKIFVTYSLDAVLAQPGLYDDLVRDLQSAFLFAEGRYQVEIPIEELTKFYRYPQTVEEVEETCQYIIDYAHEGDDPARHLIGADTETDRLEAHDPDAKIIMSSFAWEPGHATAILMDHPQAHWTPKELVRVRAAVQRVWECAKPKVLHNEKFDRKMVQYRYGWDLKNVVWDTMCGEHLIEEDKKGQYGLKILTRTRLPQYAGYDDQVDEIRDTHGGLDRVREAKRFIKARQKYEKALVAYSPQKELYDALCVDYEAAVAAWEATRLEEKAKAKVERRKMDRNAYGKKPPKPRKPKEPTPPEAKPPFDFTLIPVDDLHRYAAIDADVCRQHVLHQNQRLNAEFVNDTKVRGIHGAPAPLPVKRLMSGHDIPTSKTLSDMEFTGFPVDLPYLEKLDGILSAESDKAEARLRELAGDFTIANPKDVIAVMFQRGFYDDKVGDHVVVPINDDIRRTKKGQIKADEKALLYVHKQYGYEFPKVVLTHRKVNKARSPFLTNVRVHASMLDGRMHPSFHIPGTSTGRLSSSNENIQNCVDASTELLTARGWVRFDQLPRDIKVAQFDSETEQVSFVEPLEYIQRPCTPGEMRQLTLEQVDLCLTGAHEQLVRRQTGLYTKVAVDDIRSGSQFMHAGRYEGGTTLIDPAWIVLVCAAQADGYWTGYQWDFGFTKQRKITRLRATLDALGVVYKEGPRKGGARFYVKGTYARRLHALLGDTKQFGPWLLGWDRVALNAFLDEVMLWDGSYTRKDCYSSSVEVNADWVQIIALLSGRRARKRVYTAHGGEPNYQIDMPHGRKHSWTNHLRRETVDYTGDVYCVRVPTGNIIVRRNGKAVITGNCPKKLAGHNIKDIFIPPEGNVLVNTDAKGAEIRLFSAYSHDKKLIDAILAGQDTHSFFASQIWHDATYEEIEKARGMVDDWYSRQDKKLVQLFSEADLRWAEGLVKRRTGCKRVVFGTLYGAMAAKIAETAGIPLEEAQEIINLMFDLFPTIPAYIQSTQAEVMVYGGVYTLTGRKRRFPLNNVRMFRNKCYRQAVNFKIQSTASDIVMWVLNHIAPIIKRDLRGSLHATVHDSIVFSVPPVYLSQVADMMYEYGTKRVAERFTWLPVPFEWDIEAGDRYGSVVNIDKYLKDPKDHGSKKPEDFFDIVEGDEIREEINAELSA
ncbi:hypothetical protein KJ782_07270 [Patescibacteria group bacterium]|nr:hypothetical protein [Patescibacteria group bacterium]